MSKSRRYLSCAKALRAIFLSITFLIAGGALNGQNLTGTWVAYGYSCNGKTGPQTVSVTQAGMSIQGIKTSGDACLPAGSISFYTDISGTIQLNTYFSSSNTIEPVPATLNINSSSQFTIAPSGGTAITFYGGNCTVIGRVGVKFEVDLFNFPACTGFSGAPTGTTCGLIRGGLPPFPTIGGGSFGPPACSFVQTPAVAGTYVGTVVQVGAQDYGLVFIILDDKSVGGQVCPGGCGTGDPIDIGSGNVYETITDYVTSGTNQLVFNRYYNSLANPSTSAVSLGQNWRTEYDRYLHVTSSGGLPTSVTAERQNGQILSYSLSNGIWQGPSDVDTALSQNGQTWTFTDGADNIETYTVDTSGLGTLNSIQARGGYTQTLSYNSSGQLTSVVDSYNRALTFSYQSGLLHSVNTPDGLIVTYGFGTSSNGHLLTSVSYSTDPVTSQTYLYENAVLPGALTGVIDELGNRYSTWTYDAYGRGLSSQNAGGADAMNVAYDDVAGSRTVTNALGQQTLYLTTGLQGIRKITSIQRVATSATAAASQTFTYDANGYLASQTDWNGNLTSYVNDSHGRPTTIVEASGTPQVRTTTIAYHATFHVPVSIVTAGLTTSFTYDTAGNLLTRTETDTTTGTVPYSTSGKTRTWTYTWSNFLLASQKGPRTDVSALTKYTYDSSGALTSTTNALGQTVRISQHLPGGLPQTIVDANGVTTNRSYDARQRLLSTTVNTTAGPLTTAYTWDAAGNLVSVDQADGSIVSYTFDAAHRQTAVVDSTGQCVCFTLDALGDRVRTSTVNTAGVPQRIVTAAFDALGRQISVTQGAGQKTSWAYDGNGNVVSITDPLNQKITQAFDALNRRIKTVDSSGNTATLTWDAHDRPLTFTDPNGNNTGFVYDGFGDLMQQSSPDSGVTVYRYDAVGNRTNSVDGSGAIGNFSYDALDRIQGAQYPGRSLAENTNYSYDNSSSFGVGRLTGMQDAVGTTTRAYDERGNVVSETKAFSQATLTASYRWDAAGRLSGITYPSGWAVSYFRDPAGRISAITTRAPGAPMPWPLVSGITYAPFGPVVSLVNSNGIIESRTTDGDYRLLSITDTRATTIQNLGYVYDADDNVTKINDLVNPANNQTLSYDASNRLTSSSGSYGSLTYSYDANGNRTSLTSNSLLYQYQYQTGSNRLSSIQFGTLSQSVTYNGAGNITSFTPLTPNPATVLTYDPAQRLSSIKPSGQRAIQYTYDGLGHRVIKRAASTTLYTYDLNGHLLEETGLQGNALVDYVYLDDRPIATLSPPDGKIYFLHSDRLGTPQVATDGNQTVQWTTSYEPFGATSSNPSLIDQNLRLPGQEFDIDAGFYHNGFRDYMPQWGRYLQADPIGLGGGANAFVYARSNPVVSSDPSGLSDLNLIPRNDPGYGPNSRIEAKGYFTVTAHGGYGGVIEDQNGDEITAFRLAQLIRGSGWKPGTPIVLYVCYAGTGGDFSPASEIAHLLMTQVIGPDGPVESSPIPGLIHGLGYVPNPALDSLLPYADLRSAYEFSPDGTVRARSFLPR